MNILNLPEFLTAAEVAEIVRVSTHTVRRWGQRGVLATSVIGGHYLFSRDEVYAKLKPLFIVHQPDTTSLASL